MQLLPQGRYLIFSIGASGAVLYCSEINFDTQSTAFTRQERSHARQKDVPENTGTMPTYSQNLEGAPVQFIYGSAVTARDLTPDDDDLMWHTGFSRVQRTRLKAAFHLNKKIRHFHGGSFIYRMQEMFIPPWPLPGTCCRSHRRISSQRSGV